MDLAVFPTESVAADPKLFVLDTNVPLHDSGCLFHFQEHDVAIPITVLEELDKFKRGNELINFHAREFLRRVDESTGDALAAEGVRLGDGRGRVRVVFANENAGSLENVFYEDSPDHRILNIAVRLKEKEPDRNVILVSKDTALRMKAKAVGLPAEDYTTDKVQSVEEIYTGRRLVQGVDGDVIDELYRTQQVAADRVPSVVNPRANENFILRNGSKSALATFEEATKLFHRIDRRASFGITPRNAEQSFALQALTNDKIQLVTLAGKAGTGKTLLALAAALECRQNYRQIYLARPIVPLSNKDIGFLPGDINSKIDPYMQPLFDNLAVIRHGSDEAHGRKIGEMLENEKLLITPLAYIRGRSFQKIYFIVDEAQNLTPHEVKTIITRAGEGTKIVLTGDIHQIDQPYLDTLSNGLSYVIHRMRGQPLYAHVSLEKGERSTLAEIASDLL